MSMIKRFTFFVFMLCTTMVNAADFSGTVIDSLTGLPVRGVSVRLNGTDKGDVTDADGAFVLDLPEGRYVVRLTHVAYDSVVFRDVRAPGRVVWKLMPRVYDRAPIEVVADPVGGADLHQKPSFLTVLPRKAFESKMTSVAEVLSSSTGVQVKRLGGMGTFSTLSIRGSSAEQVVVYLDGIPLNATLGGGVNLANLPLAQVAQVEVYRGAAAGGGGMGGAVHIRSMPIEAGWRVGGTASWGSLDTRSVNAMVSRGSAQTGFLMLADYEASDNNFAFLDDNGTEYNVDDDEVVPRRNSDFVSGSMLGKWHLNRGRLRVAVQENVFWKHIGIPGLGNFQAERARLHTVRSLTEWVTRVSDLWNGFAAHQQISLLYRRERFMDPEGEIGVGRKDNTYRTQSMGWRGGVNGILGDRYSVNLEGYVHHERFVPDSDRQSNLPESSRWTAEGRMGLDMELPGDRGAVSLSGQFARLRDRLFEQTIFRVSPLAPDTTVIRKLINVRMGVRLDVVSGFWLKANAGRSHRAPSFFELFGDRGGVVGNTRLKPEKGTSWDAGFRVEKDAQSLEAAYFEQRYEDLIQFVQTSQSVSRPNNIGRARIRGMELSARGSVRHWLDVSGNYTLQRATDQSDVPHQNGKRLPNRPVHEVLLRGDWHFGRATFFYDYTFEDGNFLDRANLRPIPARHIHNVGMRISIRDKSRLTVEAKNWRNSQIADQWGYPLPGRLYFVTVQETF